MEYIKINPITKEIIEYPYLISKLFLENPNTSFPASLPQSVLSDYDIYEVSENEKPPYNQLTQTIYTGTPYILNGSWVVDWLIRDLTIEELYGKVNYIEFWNSLVQSPIYQTIRQQASESLIVNVNCTEFMSLLSEAKLGFANPTLIQMSINELINSLTLTIEEYNLLNALLESGNMNLIYTLPPRP